MDENVLTEFSRHLFRLQVTNSEGKSIFAGDHADEKVEIYVNENKTVVIPYLAEKADEVTVRGDFQKLNSMLFFTEIF